MDVRKLEAFCKVYELQNFSKAGEVMYLSQPTISSHVANLEDELDVKLFDRLGRKVLPTQAGKALYRSAVRVFENLEQAKASIEMLRDNVVGELAIGCSTIPAHAILPSLLADFSRRYPDVQYIVHTSDSADVIKRVAAGEWPLGIVGQKPELDELAALELLEDETVLVAAADAPWLPDLSIPVEVDELLAMPWVMREKGSATRRVLEKALGQAGQSVQNLNIRCRVTGTGEALAHTLSGVGVSMTSQLSCKSYLESGAMVRLNVPALEGRRHFYLIYHNARHMFPAFNAFINFVR